MNFFLCNNQQGQGPPSFFIRIAARARIKPAASWAGVAREACVARVLFRCSLPALVFYFTPVHPHIRKQVFGFLSFTARPNSPCRTQVHLYFWMTAQPTSPLSTPMRGVGQGKRLQSPPHCLSAACRNIAARSALWLLTPQLLKRAHTALH